MDELAWIVLRIVYAWMYLYPAVGLIKNWNTTVQTTSLAFPVASSFFAFASLVIMIGGALSILFGVYGQLGGLALCIFNLGGALIHYKLANIAKKQSVSKQISPEDGAAFDQASSLAVVGNTTSAEKNFPLAALGLFFFIIGTGPLSLVDKIFFS